MDCDMRSSPLPPMLLHLLPYLVVCKPEFLGENVLFLSGFDAALSLAIFLWSIESFQIAVYRLSFQECLPFAVRADQVAYTVSIKPGKRNLTLFIMACSAITRSSQRVSSKIIYCYLYMTIDI